MSFFLVGNVKDTVIYKGPAENTGDLGGLRAGGPMITSPWMILLWYTCILTYFTLLFCCIRFCFYYFGQPPERLANE